MKNDEDIKSCFSEAAQAIVESIKNLLNDESIKDFFDSIPVANTPEYSIIVNKKCKHKLIGLNYRFYELESIHVSDISDNMFTYDDLVDDRYSFFNYCPICGVDIEYRKGDIIKEE